MMARFLCIWEFGQRRSSMVTQQYALSNSGWLHIITGARILQLQLRFSSSNSLLLCTYSSFSKTSRRSQTP